MVSKETFTKIIISAIILGLCILNLLAGFNLAAGALLVSLALVLCSSCVEDILLCIKHERRRMKNRRKKLQNRYGRNQ